MEYQTTIPLKTVTREIYSVSRLNREARALLEGSFPPIWIEGEISNLAKPSSGHCYFVLKDALAQVRCALFRSQLRLANVVPRDGMHVLVRARLTLYEGRGEYQLVIEHLEEAGEGALRRAFEALKIRLAQEGLFDTARKRPLPRLPKRIGLITSPTGAVLHDIVTTLKRRFPAIPILLYPVPVQGKVAAIPIAETIRLAGSRRDCDVIILARGGGSLEDLWAFNEEIVARAIVDCPIPIVSGVGHETDFTIADLAADVRAPTPTGAAELVSPNQQEWLVRFREIEASLIRCARHAVRTRAQHVDGLAARVLHPRARLRHLAHQLEALTHRLVLAQSQRLHRAHSTVNVLATRLERRSPLARLRACQQDARHCYERLVQALARRLADGHKHVAHLARSLNALSPLATLDRGYAIVRTISTGSILRDANAVNAGDTIETRLARGRLICEVKERHDK